MPHRSLFEVLTIVACLATLLTGVLLAALSIKDPARATFLERWSGVCLVVGLCMLGASLHLTRG